MKTFSKRSLIINIFTGKERKILFFINFFVLNFFFVQQHKNIIKSKQLLLHESIIKITAIKIHTQKKKYIC